jgi:hypothetical protein
MGAICDLARPALLAAALCWSSADLGAQALGATIGGRVVRREAGTPVDGARVAVLGTGLAVVSDSTGGFAIPDVPPGVRVIQVRAVGYEPGTWIVQLGEGQQFRQDLELNAFPIEVAGVTVRGEPAGDWRTPAGFERRRQAGRGFFLTQGDIESRRPRTIADLLRAVPGASVTCRGAYGCYIGLGRNVGRLCRPEYFLDGYPATFATGPAFPINQIRGVEVYRDQSETPMEFQRPGLRCGVIAIWTIEPGDRLGR